MSLNFDISAKSIIKSGETLCGDSYIISSLKEKQRIIIIDGLGSGLMANLHSNMTAKMIMSLAEKSNDPEKVLSFAMQNLIEDKSRQADYYTFIYVEIENSGETTIINYNMPTPVLLHYGVATNFSKKKTIVKDKNVMVSNFTLKSGDILTILSDGVIKAGIGATLNLGLGQKNVAKYLENSYKPKMSSEKITELLLNVCNSLYLEKPGDDCTVAVIKTKSKE